MNPSTTTKKSEYLTRDAILALLSEAEVTRVSTIENGARLADGEEYIDLEHPLKGVRRVQASTPLKMSKVLPRRALLDATWSKICTRILQ